MKPGTFTQIYVQLVFAVKNRETALRKEIRKKLINLKLFKMNMFNILKNVKWNLMNNSYMNSVRILFNLFEVIKPFLISRATIV